MCLIFVIIIWPTQASSEPLRKKIDFNHADYYLVTASQEHSDLTISLFDVDKDKLIKTISFPWHKALPEKMLVQRSDCNRCEVIINGQGVADRTKPYKYSIKALESDLDITFFRHLDKAGTYAFRSRAFSAEERSSMLTQSQFALEAAIEAAPDLEKRLHAMTLLAETFYNLDDDENQRDVLQKILSLTDNLTGQVFRIQALYESAAFIEDLELEHALYDEGMELATQLKFDRLSAVGANFKAVGLVRNGEFKVAIELLQKAKIIFTASHHWRDLMYVLHNLSWAHQRAGDLPASLRFATAQRLTAEHFELAEHKVLGLYNFAMTYGQLSQLKEAEGFLSQALIAYNQLPVYSGLSTVMGGYLLEERARRLLQLGAYTNAADIANKSKLRFEETGYPGRVADAVFLEGEIAMAGGDLSLARNKYKEVIQYDRDNHRKRSLGVHLLRLAELEIKDGQLLRASSLHNESLGLLAETADYRVLASALGQSCELLYHMGAVEDANDFLVHAQSYTDKFGLEFDKAKLHYRVALIKSKLGLLSEALEQTNAAKKLIDKALESIEQLDMRRYFFALQRNVLELNIELLIATEPDDANKSLALAEAMRSRTLKEKLKSGKRKGVDHKQYLVNRALLLAQIRSAAEEWHGPNNPIANNLLETTRELGLKLEKLEANYRLLSKGSQTLANVDSLPKREASEGQLFAFYLVGDKQSWLWAIHQDGVELYKLPSRGELAKLIANYHLSVTTAPASRTNQDAWTQRDAIDALSRVIIHPLKNVIDTKNISRLIVVPDGALHTVPFTPLTLKPQGLPLIKRLSVNVDVGLETENVATKPLENQHNNKRILVVSNSEPNKALATQALPNSLYEADIIGNIFGQNATLLSGLLATKKNFLSQPLQSYDILHFATHGLINTEEPLLSGLTFSNGEEGALWLAPEISGASLEGKLIVMSACQSAIGILMSDEGALSLTRAFIEAGASYVVGSLWSIQDKPSSILMQNFYDALINQRYQPDDALRFAQLSMMTLEKQRWSDPYYWAGFQLNHSRKPN